MKKTFLSDLVSDRVRAVNWLLMVYNHAYTVSIEDTMYAYMIAHTWYRKIKDSPQEMFISGQIVNKEKLKELFGTYLEGFEREILNKESSVKECLDRFHPYLQGDEETRLYNRTRFLAALLYSKHGNNSYYKTIKTRFYCGYIKEKYFKETGEIAFRLWMFANAVEALSYTPNYEKAMNLKEKITNFSATVIQNGTKADKFVLKVMLNALP